MRWGGAAMNNWVWMKCFSDDYTFYKYLVTPQIKSVKKSCVYPHNSLPPTRSGSGQLRYLLFSLPVRLLFCQNSTNILLTLLSQWCVWREREWEPRGRINQPLFRASPVFVPSPCCKVYLSFCSSSWFLTLILHSTIIGFVHIQPLCDFAIQTSSWT